MPTNANARRWDAGRVLVLVSGSLGVINHRALFAGSPAPGGGGWGVGGTRVRTTQPGPAPGGASKGPPPPQGGPQEADTGAEDRRRFGATRTKQKPKFCLVRAGGMPELLTKLGFCWVRPVPRAELQRDVPRSRSRPLREPHRGRITPISLDTI